ncbi:MAG: c-type cytochrome, partial [Akkermansiaceae bacterium]
LANTINLCPFEKKCEILSANRLVHFMKISKFLFISWLVLCSSFTSPAQDKASLVTDADTGITLRESFDAELLYEIPEEQGSWVAMSFDPKGRLVVSDQDDKGVYRVTLPRDNTPIKVEPLKGFPYEPINWGKRKVGGALGFLHAFDSLYMVTMTGLYRCQDTNGDDSYDKFELLKKLRMGYEHSAHNIIKTEDGKGLYLVSGNYGRIPKDVPSLQPPFWQKDSLLESMPDQMGHAVSIKVPAGWVSRISPDGSEWTMISSGYRNPVDLAINREGELFTFDSDLEFDVGSPWYRPTRVCHVTSASEFGWRNGSAKWREYFADSNGPVLNIGPGSPTGVSFGHHAQFPPYYQDKLFVCDWTFGTIYTIMLEEDGSSYTGTKEEFLHGHPLNITAMRFGPDGNMYFLTGGRNTDSKLYRVRYTQSIPEEPSRQLTNSQKLRDLRHSLEAFHGSNNGGEKAINIAWQHLDHDDRSIRYAARLAIECQDLPLWQSRVFAEENTRQLIYGAIALARHGEPELSARVIAKLKDISFDKLVEEDQLALLRAYSLCFIRLEKPSAPGVASIISQLDSHYPAKDDRVNAELCRVLSYLDAPSIVAKTIRLMKSTQTATVAYDKEMLERSEEYGQEILKMMSKTPNSQNIHYTYCLRQVLTGWTLDDRKYYFGWLNETLKKGGGKSFAGYIRAIRQDAIDHLPPETKASISWLLGDIAGIDLSKLPIPKGPPVAWTIETAMKQFKEPLTGRDFENGKKMFSAGRCVACHRFSGSGGYSGPDLGSVGNRYSIRDIVVAICEPSQSISEQYQASTITLKDGSGLYGRLIYKNDKEVAVAPNPFNFGDLQKNPAHLVKKIEPSQISMMPAGTINAMNKEELKDLVAYLLSGGNKKHEAFQKK